MTCTRRPNITRLKSTNVLSHTERKQNTKGRNKKTKPYHIKTMNQELQYPFPPCSQLSPFCWTSGNSNDAQLPGSNFFRLTSTFVPSKVTLLFAGSMTYNSSSCPTICSSAVIWKRLLMDRGNQFAGVKSWLKIDCSGFINGMYRFCKACDIQRVWAVPPQTAHVKDNECNGHFYKEFTRSNAAQTSVF